MEILTSLEATKNATLALYDLPPEKLALSYAPGKWTVQQILVHVADAESILHERIKRVIAEPKQVIWAFDQDMFCNNLDYTTYPLALSKSLYVANRNCIIYLAGKFYETFGANEYIHSEVGLRTLKMEFDKVAMHNQSHIDQILRAIK